MKLAHLTLTLAACSLSSTAATNESETPMPTGTSNECAASATASGVVPTVSALVDINTADEATLRALADVTQERAQAIIAGRRNGLYKLPVDLIDRKILPATVFERIKACLKASQP